MDQREIERFRAALKAGVPPLAAEERTSWIKCLDDLALASDGYIPFRDNVDQAARHGVRYIAEPGGSTRNEEVDIACQEHGITHISTGVRLFLH